MVKHWVEEYEKDKKTAMVELLTMLFEVIQCCVLIIPSSEGYFIIFFVMGEMQLDGRLLIISHI